MQPELPKIDIASQAEVWSRAEHRRAEEISGWLKLAVGRWAANAHRRWQFISDAVQIVSAAPRTGKQRSAPSRG